jgi:hypothetical protein
VKFQPTVAVFWQVCEGFELGGAEFLVFQHGSLPLHQVD